MTDKQKIVNAFYESNGPCCAGCDHWRWHNTLVGECTKSAPVAGSERYSMVGIINPSITIESGHIMTDRAHICGEFKDQ